jgi:acetolactate synthase-1/3 small subunit
MAVHDPSPIESHVISVLVENKAGVLSHVVGLFSARGFNIASLAVGETEDPTMSRITLVAEGDQRTIEQIKKQLNKLIDVIKVQDLTQEMHVDSELMLVKMKTSPKLKDALAPLASKYRMHVLEEGEKITIVQCVESRENTRKLFAALKNIGILEIAQTGTVALSKKAPKD